MKKTDSAAYYHVCTDGNAIEWMFKDTTDFIAGINRIGTCAIETSVQILAFILMDNHVHFVLYGTMPQCKDFITKYKTLTGRWISKRYGLSGYLKHLPAQLILIENEEQLLDTIAYIDRNSIVAGYNLLPSEYPWGSAKYLFKEKHPAKTTEISELNRSEQQYMLKTWTALPPAWLIAEDGMILPECFLQIKTVERLFKSPVRYLYFLSKKLEGKLEMQEGTKTFIPDKELRPIIEKLAKQLFGSTDIRALDFNSRILLARKLRYQYASTPKQISRMVYLDHEVIAKFV